MGAEDLGDVPGGERVMAKANRVNKADTGSITSTRNTLQQAADQAAQSHRSITGTLSGISAAWKGNDADAFHGYLSKFAAASQMAKQHLNEGIAGLDKAVKELDQAKARITTALHNIREDYQKALKTATAHAAAQKPPATVDKQGLADKAIAAHEHEIDSAVQDAEHALGTIAKDLHVSVTGLDKQFSILPHPNTGNGGTSPSSAQVNYGDGGGGGYSGGGGGGGGGGAAGGSGSTYTDGGGGGGLGSSGGPPAGPVPGNVQQWIDEAIKELQARGIKVSKDDISKIWSIIQHESGGNPHAINNWDSNAAAGHPSKGLMQCIDSTFQSYKLPGHNDIWNPVDNICAGVNYAISRYGSLGNVPGIAAMASGGGYQGY